MSKRLKGVKLTQDFWIKSEPSSSSSRSGLGLEVARAFVFFWRLFSRFPSSNLHDAPLQTPIKPLQNLRAEASAPSEPEKKVPRRLTDGNDERMKAVLMTPMKMMMLRGGRRRHSLDNLDVAQGLPGGQLLLERDANAVEILAGHTRLGHSGGRDGLAHAQGAGGGGRSAASKKRSRSAKRRSRSRRSDDGRGRIFVGFKRREDGRRDAICRRRRTTH